LIVAGLTGGIASGKSTVSGFFKEAGAFIIDADRIAHEVVKRGLPAHDEIIRQFGSKVLLPGGELNRILLGDIIFKDPEKKIILNSIVHPHVKRRADQDLKQIEQNHPDAVVILDVPLLFESGMQIRTSEVILVYVPEQIQLERLMHRNHFSREDALARIRSQMPIEEKKNLATILIDNSGTISDTQAQTLEVYRHLKSKLSAYFDSP
jgi:dephospho-CoA kinase